MIKIELEEFDADLINAFLRRMTWDEFQGKAQDEKQAYEIRDAVEKLQKQLPARI